jgi:phospholipase/carboxylesterase
MLTANIFNQIINKAYKKSIYFKLNMLSQIDIINLQECNEGYEVVPKEKAKGILILLHGYGASGDDLISLAPILAQDLHDYYFFSPNAIDKYGNGGGYQWFEITDIQDLNDTFCKGLLYCQNKVANLIKQKIIKVKELYNLDQKCPISILGFSQGAALALHLVCSGLLPEVKSVVSFSGAFVKFEEEIYCNNKEINILLLHGKEDQIIDYSYSLNSKHELNNLGFHSVECTIFNNLGHSISYEGLNAASKFIANSNL